MDALNPERSVKESFQDFLENFVEDDGESSQTEALYVGILKEIIKEEPRTLYVSFRHLQAHSFALASNLIQEFLRYLPVIKEATIAVIRKIRSDIAVKLDCEVGFYDLPAIDRVRSLRSTRVGQLCAVTGTITRTTEVRPELVLGTFECQECASIIENVQQQFKFCEPMLCTNQECKNTRKWKLDVHMSKFADWQRMRLQENSEEIPPGSMPRSVDIVLRNDCVEKAKAGDRVIIVGTLVVVPDVTQMYKLGEIPQSVAKQAGRASAAYQGQGVTGLRALGVRDLTYRLSFLASSVRPAMNRGDDISIRGTEDDDAKDEDEHRDPKKLARKFLEELTEERRRKLIEMQADSHLYTNLSRSIAPKVCEHDEVKRGILLMLFGGVHKKTPENIRLRGDINVCVVGDPSTAKSQFLKYVCSFLPRAVYTSGKASSAAGLTASVVRDPDTGEFGIEAGALMLADNGICCIDEFDKMDPRDQVAIHEAMEQQSISITKAGIQATLNARTSILAAANPIFGRYDTTRTLRQNVAIPPPILSRFDLFFVILDECEESSDMKIAMHIVNVHRGSISSGARAPYTRQELQTYIRFARFFHPKISDAAHETFVRCYRQLRCSDATGVGKRNAYRITVRQLESMVRLSEAMARLHLREQVEECDVREAFRLLSKSVISVTSPDVVLANPSAPPQQPPQQTQATADSSAPDTALDTIADTAGDADGMDVETQETETQEDVVISWEEYQRIARLMCIRLREVEDQATAALEGGDIGDDVQAGLTRLELVSWVLQQEGLDSMEELGERRVVYDGVIDMLIGRDNVLVVVPSEPEDLLMVHPNFAMGQ